MCFVFVSMSEECFGGTIGARRGAAGSRCWRGLIQIMLVRMP